MYIHMYVAVCTCTESMSNVEKGVVIVKGGLKKEVDESAMHLPRAPPNTLPILPKVITVCIPQIPRTNPAQIMVCPVYPYTS